MSDRFGWRINKHKYLIFDNPLLMKESRAAIIATASSGMWADFITTALNRYQDELDREHRMSGGPDKKGKGDFVPGF